ncbi:hypothetical protein BKA80DRAFT_280115 [Phyllosticta citrichinensis]
MHQARSTAPEDPQTLLMVPPLKHYLPTSPGCLFTYRALSFCTPDTTHHHTHSTTMPLNNNESGVSSGVKFVTSTVGNTVGGLLNTVGGASPVHRSHLNNVP